MSNKITGKEYQLKKVFSKEFNYYIPPYQRPYAWTEVHTETLMDNLLDFFAEQPNDNYFLGSVVLIKKDEEANSQVIDGQQRLTTLTILISCITSFLTGEEKVSCDNYIKEPGNRIENLKPQPRLHLREKDRDFFNKYIQEVKLDALLAEVSESLPNESQQHIKANCALILNKLKEKFSGANGSVDKEKILEFCSFLMNNCYLVVVYTSDAESAFRVFSVMNSTGLSLLPIDIIKSEIIGAIPENERELYTDRWEDLEVQTSRSGFNDVFSHIRMIFSKTKAKKGLLDEFREFVIPKTTPKKLIDDILEPYCNAYTILVNKKYVATCNAEEINQYLFWLNKIDNSDWMPVAIKFMAEHKNEPDYVLLFIKKLERLASFLHITAKDINKRIERYKRVLEEMESNPEHCISDPLLSMELSNAEKKEFVKVLDGEIYKLTAVRRNFVLLRLNAFVGDGATRFDFEPNILTIEHILPQHPLANSMWDKTWPNDEEREQWLNRIANLVPLTRKKNSAAQNYEFEKKKATYFTGKNGTTTYPLTTQVLNEQEWTPEVVERRQNDLIAKFKEHWELDYVDVKPVSSSQLGENTLFYIKNKRGASAVGYPRNAAFIVKKESKISDEIVTKFEERYENAFNLRKQLVEKEIIKERIFQADYEFGSISLAASVVLGRNARGQKEWVDSNNVAFDER